MSFEPSEVVWLLFQSASFYTVNSRRLGSETVSSSNTALLRMGIAGVDEEGVGRGSRYHEGVLDFSCWRTTDYTRNAWTGCIERK